MKLELNFDVNPLAAARELAAQLGSNAHDEDTYQWHRAVTGLDELSNEKLYASREERNAHAQAKLMRESEHARRTRSALTDLYYLPWEKVAAQIANPPTDPVEPEPSEPSTSVPSTSTPSGEARAKGKAKAAELCEQAAKKIRKDVKGYLERHAGEGDDTARQHAAITFALIKTTARVALTDESLVSVQEQVAGIHNSMADLSKMVGAIIEYIRARDGTRQN